MINIALVGCGRISYKHFESLIKLNKFFNIRAICDVDQKNLKDTVNLINQLNKEQNITKTSFVLFNEYEYLLNEIQSKKIDIDLIVLCTPSGYHPSQAKKAAEIGVNVCTEKPLATNLDEGLELLKIFKNNDKKLFVVLQNRLNPTIKLLKKQIDSGRFGKLFLITSNVFWQRPQTYYDIASWRGTKKLDGGAMLNQSSHYVDLMCFLPNLKVKKVGAFANTLGRNIEMEDTAVLNLEYENGTVGNLSLTMLTYPKNIEGSVTILGENGTAKIGGLALNKIETWQFRDSHEDDKLVEKVNYDIDSVYGSGHLSFYKEIKDILLNEKPNSFSVHEGFLSLEVIMAAYKAIEGNEVFYL